MRKRGNSSIQTPTTPLASSIQKFDAYAKTIEDFSTKTFFGGLVTLVSTAIVVILIIAEFWNFSQITMLSRMSVDAKRRDLLPINFNISFPKIPCFLLSIDVMDSSGEHQNNVEHTVFKVRMDKNGDPIESSKTPKLGTQTTEKTKELAPAGAKECGDCYGAAEKTCCNSCRDVIRAYEQKGWTMNDLNKIKQCVDEGWADIVNNQKSEGCTMHGQLQPFRELEFDFTHVINEMSFGTKWEGVVNPLDGFRKDTKSRSYVYNYYIEVVSTDVIYLNGTKLSTNQYSVTHHERESQAGMGLIGLFFHYDISPMIIEYVEQQPSLTSFLTKICAIVGGIYTIAGVIDSWIYKAQKNIAKKMDLGKAQ